jgi:hypothetical protein
MTRARRGRRKQDGYTLAARAKAARVAAACLVQAKDAVTRAAMDLVRAEATTVSKPK